MTQSKRKLTTAERHDLIATLAGSFGGAPERWPLSRTADLRDPETGTLQLSAAEWKLCDDARAMDIVLDSAAATVQATPDVARLQAAILRQTVRSTDDDGKSFDVDAGELPSSHHVPISAARHEAVSWRHSAAMAAALMLGIFAGSSGLLGDAPTAMATLLSDQQTSVALIDVEDAILGDEEDTL